MSELEIYKYVLMFMCFVFGLILGAVIAIIRMSKIDDFFEKEKLKSVCQHHNSHFSDTHPDFPWTCNHCGSIHNNNGINQE